MAFTPGVLPPGVPVTCADGGRAHGAAQPRQEGGERWTLIVRAENGPSPLNPCLPWARACALTTLMSGLLAS